MKEKNENDKNQKTRNGRKWKRSKTTPTRQRPDSDNAMPPSEILSAFAEALRRLALKKRFEKIIIQDLAVAAGYSKRSFYNYFRNKWDLLFWSYAEKDYNALKKIEAGQTDMQYGDLFRDRIRTIAADRDLFKGVFDHWIFSESFCEVSINHAIRITNEYLKLRGVTTIPPQLLAVMRHYFAGNVHEVGLWLVSPQRKTVDELIDELLFALPAPLAELLRQKAEG